MSTTLLDIHNAVKTSLARGTALDTTIPQYVRQAALWLERNHTFQYMKKFGTFTVLATAVEPRVVAFPSDRVKEMLFVRIVDADGAFTYLQRVDPSDVADLPTEQPVAYWLSGVDSLILNSTPDEDIDVEISWTEFTAWPTETSATNWLIQTGEDVLVAQTLVKMAPLLRDPRMQQLYATERAEALRTLLAADEMLQFSDRQIKVNYR